MGEQQTTGDDRLWEYGRDTARPLAELERVERPTAFDVSELVLAGVYATTFAQEREVLDRLRCGEAVDAVLADLLRWQGE